MNSPLQPNEHKDEILNALEYYYLEVKKLDITIGEAESMAEAKLLAYIESEKVSAVDKKLQTLQEATPYLELCEDDANKILMWAKNHRWSLIAPPGENLTNRESD